MRRVLVATIICLCGGTAFAQLPTTEVLGDRVDAIAKETLSRHVAGISIGVARDGQVLARGYGMANLEHSVAVTPETVFHIASISKNILAAVVLQLVDEGKLRLDDDVSKYVPEAPTHGKHVTVRQLLNHTSGIYSFTSLPNAADNERFDLTHVFIDPVPPAAVGKQAMRERNDRLTANKEVKVLSYVPEYQEMIFLDGGWEVEWRPYTVSVVTSPGRPPVHLRGRVLGVHKKMPDGSWKGFRAAGITD